MTDVTNSLRAHWAELSLQRFEELSGSDPEHTLVDLLGDLMHWAKQKDFDFDLALERARGHFDAEIFFEEQAHPAELEPYSVLVKYPDFLTDGDCDTYYAFVEAKDAAAAGEIAKLQAIVAGRLDAAPGEFNVLLVVPGHHQAEA